MNFTLSKGDIKIVVAYGALALHTLQNSANAENKKFKVRWFYE